MNKTASIRKYFQNWRFANISIDELVKKHETSKKYIYEVFRKEKIHDKYGEEKDSSGGIYLNHEFSIREVIESLESGRETIQITPKVKELPNGKVQMIIQSKMNYELHK